MDPPGANVRQASAVFVNEGAPTGSLLPSSDGDESNNATMNSSSNNNNNNNSINNAFTVPNSPPVVPATLLRETSHGIDARNSSLNAYPVASFVRDWVRTSMMDNNNNNNSNSSSHHRNQQHSYNTYSPHNSRAFVHQQNFRGFAPSFHRDSVPSAAAAATANTTNSSNNNSNSNSYMRSNSVVSNATDEDDGNSAATTTTTTTRPDYSLRTHSDLLQPLTHRRRISLEEMTATHASAPQIMERGEPLDDSVEYILVDGDLIAIPPPPPNQAEQEFMEAHLRQAALAQQQQQQPGFSNADLVKSCQPKRVRRGVRKLTRFFKRGGGGKQQQNQIQQQQDQQIEHKQQAETTANSSSQSIRPDSSSASSTTAPTVTTTSAATMASTSISPSSYLLDRSTAASAPYVAATAAAATRPTLQQQSHQSFGPISLREQELSAAVRSLSPVRDVLLPQQQQQSPDRQRLLQHINTLDPRKTALTLSEAQQDTKSPTRQQQKLNRQGKGKRWGVRGRRKAPPSSSVDTRKNDETLSDEMGMETQLMTGLAPPSTPQHLAAAAASASRGLVATANDGMRPLLDPPSSDYMRSSPPVPQALQDRLVSSGGSSVTASYVGTTDQWTAGVVNSPYWVPPPDMSIAESFVEDDGSGVAIKKDDDDNAAADAIPLPLSLVSDQADYKVDKADTPDVEAMLRRAVLETNVADDFERDSDSLPNVPLPDDYDHGSSFKDTMSLKPAAAEQNRTYSLTEAPPNCTGPVINDTLKVFMISANAADKTWLARKLRNSQSKRVRKRNSLPIDGRKRTTLAVDVHEWRQPPSVIKEGSADAECASSNNINIKCVIWDVQGASNLAETRSNFGVHPGTQSLFFSAQSLYILVWDLACHNAKANRIEVMASRDYDDDEDSDFDDEDENDDFVREEANRQADRALHADITNRVFAWLDCIAQRSPRSAVLPVALIPENMSESEVQRRCDTFQNLLKDHVQRYDMTRNLGSSSSSSSSPPKLLTGASDNLLCVRNYGECEGLAQLQEMVWAIASDPSHSVFDHVGTPVPPGTARVYAAIQKFKRDDHKLVLLDHVLGEIGGEEPLPVIVRALQFLASIGKILYFSEDDEDGVVDDVLSRYIILERRWLISALSCILRNGDLKRELDDTRRFMNMQCIYTDERYQENDVTQALLSGKLSSCPLLSDRDAQMLWQNLSFMQEASNRYSNMVERSTTTPTMFYFLERLLVRSGVFLPLQISQQNASLDKSEVFFVPSLLPVAHADPQLWSYMTSESWTTTLCHSWLFRDGSPSNLMEHLTVKVLRDLYEFSRTFQPGEAGVPPNRCESARAHTDPTTRESFGEFFEEHNNEALGCVRVHQVVCFLSSMLVKIGTVFADAKTNQLRESFVEVFIAVVDQSSPNAVASDVMRPYMQRVVVSGKGQAGKHGLKLWKGGYKCILGAVRDCLSEVPNVDSQVICPECLATSSPRIASTWGWDSVLAVAKSGNPSVICLRGHRVSSNLICGLYQDKKTPPAQDLQTLQREKLVSIQELLPSIVLVGVWDPDKRSIVNIGSGFIVDKKVGLVVTAGHVLFQMKDREKPNFAKPYHGIIGGRAVVGVIPDADDNGKHAVFRYFADVAAHNILSADVCVLRIISRLETDVDDKVGIAAIAQPEQSISTLQMQGQGLRSLKMTTKFQLEETVRITGYNQGGEGIFEQGRHISRSVDVVGGSICRHFKATIQDDSSATSDSSTSQHAFIPKDEIVVMCSTISGHSGGPCVNSEGKVVGILSRSDPADRERCYLVPASEIKPLVVRAKHLCMGTEQIRERVQTM